MKFFQHIKSRFMNLRREKRGQVLEKIDCYIQRKSAGTPHKVLISDISENGMGCLLRSPDVEIGDEVSIKLNRTGLELNDVRGRIVGQHIFYISKADDLNKAYFRFSVQFEKPIGRDQLEFLQIK